MFYGYIFQPGFANILNFIHTFWLKSCTKMLFVEIFVFLNAHNEEGLNKSLDPTLVDDKDMKLDERLFE